MRLYTLVVPLKTIADSRPKWARSIPVFRPEWHKTIPFGVAHTYNYGLCKGVLPPVTTVKIHKVKDPRIFTWMHASRLIGCLLKHGFHHIRKEKCKKKQDKKLFVLKSFLFVLFRRPWMKKLSAKTRELRLKFVLKLVCFYLIMITSKSLMRQCWTLVMPVIMKNSEVNSCHLYNDPKWDSIHSVF